MKFEIWMQGFLVTGMEGIPQKAQLLAEIEAETFDDAVRQHVASLKPDDARFYRQAPDGTWVCWGCRLFDNEADARRFLG